MAVKIEVSQVAPSDLGVSVFNILIGRGNQFINRTSNPCISVSIAAQWSVIVFFSPFVKPLTLIAAVINISIRIIRKHCADNRVIDAEVVRNIDIRVIHLTPA